MTETIELSIHSKLEFVDMVGSVTKSVTAKMGFDEDDASWIELAVHEAVINAITHGNRNAPDKQARDSTRISCQTLPTLITCSTRPAGVYFICAHLWMKLSIRSIPRAAASCA
jgi:anti-sigma regulatory factor (Ser/Thr protein kinase)